MREPATDAGGCWKCVPGGAVILQGIASVRWGVRHAESKLTRQSGFSE